MRGPNVLVVYVLRQHPLRATIRDHLYAFRRYGSGRTAYLNLAVRRRVPRWARRADWDLVVFHTSYLATFRWRPDGAPWLRRRSAPLRGLGRVRAALPQDDFLRSDLVGEVMEELGVDHVFTPVPESERRKVYRRMDLERVRFHLALTGYLDDDEVARMERVAAEVGEDGRDIDVGYRAWHAARWLGRHGQLKTEIARLFSEEGPRHGLRVDISTRDEDTLYGDDWSRFMARSKYTIGVEGGASILDRDGSLRARVYEYELDHPDASFDEVEAACFPGRDGELALFAVSPRHLEACVSRTCQVLVRGQYNGVLEADRHYLPLEPDFSNLDEVLETMRRDDRRAEITRTAYEDVVRGGRWTYRGLVVRRRGRRAAARRRAAGGSPAAGGAGRPAELGLGRGAHACGDPGLAVGPAFDPRSRRAAAQAAGLRPRPGTRLAPMSRVVALTPASLDADSRTLRQAGSIVRLGHETTVVEALQSTAPPAEEGFDLVTLRSVGESMADAEGAGAIGRGRVERVAGLLGRAAGPLYFLASWLAFNLSTARRLPRAELYWVHGYEQCLAVWLRRRPYVYDAHDYYVALPHDGRRLTFNERATHRVRLAIEAVCVRRAAARVTTSRTMARLYEERFGRPFTVLRNAHDRGSDQPSEDDVRSVCRAGERSFLVAMVGNRKPGTILPERVPPGIDVAIVGAGYEDVAPPERVHLTGAVPPEQVVSFLRTADAAALFYVPVNENSPAQLVNGLFHAVGAGLPLLYPSAMDAIRDLSEHYGLGVAFDPADAGSFAAAVAALRADIGAIAERVRAAQPELEWATEERKLAAILDGALGPTP